MPTLIKVIIHASFYAGPINKPLRFALESLGLTPEIDFLPVTPAMHTFATYRPSYEQNSQDISHVVLTSSGEIWPEPLVPDGPDVAPMLNTKQSLARFMENITGSCHMGLWAKNVESADRRAERIGNIYGIPNLSVFDLSEAIEDYSVERLHSRGNENSDLHQYSSEAYASFALAVARSVASRYLPRPKVLVLDCDGTLWNGDCSEEQSLTIGPAHLAVQRLALRHREGGTLLAIASRNDVSDVLRAFESVSGMLLQRKDITIWKVNWSRKSLNIIEIASELGLSPEHLLLLDNDEFECAEVWDTSGVSAIWVPEEIELRNRTLRLCWLLDRTNTPTQEDQIRNDSYAAHVIRQQELSNHQSLVDFLRFACLRTTVRKASHAECERVSQLTNRANQFNSTGARWTASQVIQRVERTWVVLAEDRYGAYGLVAAALTEVGNESLIVESFTVSCRALHRHIEDSLLVDLSRFAFERGLKRIIIKRHSTGRNGRFQEFCARLVSAVAAEQASDAIFCDVSRIISTSREASFGCVLGGYNHETTYQRVQPPSDYPQEVHIKGYMSTLFNVKTASDLLRQISQSNGTRKGYSFDSDSHVRRRVEELWKQLLSVSQISRDDDFFALGGDSLQALEMLYSINDLFDVEVELSLLFESSFTIDRLTQAVTSALSLREMHVNVQ